MSVFSAMAHLVIVRTCITSVPSAGESLRAAIGMSGNDKLSVKLNTSIPSDDAHSIDIKYHKNCWAIHGSHVLRKETSESSSEKLAGKIIAQIEFLTMTEMN